MLKLLLKIFGWLVAHAPEPLLHVFSRLTGDFIFFGFARRRRLILSNLHHAFPERDSAWHRRIGRTSCHRLVETALLSLATPFLSETRLRQIISASPGLRDVYVRHQESPAPTLICSPHIAYWEAQTSMALVVPAPFPEFGTIFRPLDNEAANEWVQRSRERFGMRLLSRKEGFQEALRILRRRGFVGVLFDQNAGLQGALTLLFGRVCSTTELPGLMAEKFNARVYGIFPRRLGFWRVEIGADHIECESSSEAVTLGLNRWLESLLARDEALCPSWLWAHDRWRNQDIPAKRLRLEAKRDLLGPYLRSQGLSTQTLPRKTRIWVRLPNWLGDVVMAVPLLRAIRTSRPDAEITVIAKAQFIPLLKIWDVADQFRSLPKRGAGYFAHFWRLRHEYPDVYLLFTNSVRGDLEAWLTRCRQRFGIVRSGRRRPLLSHRFHVPVDFDESRHHQLELWKNFLAHFGLNSPPDRTPLLFSTGEAFVPRASIGLICGSENMPAKRWPIGHWRALIAAFPEQTFVLFGTPGDLEITRAVAQGFPAERVVNLAGKTDLPGFFDRLRECALVVTNDTGGMHLANALGVPLIALFGPTNPVRTGPIFDRLVTVLQPPGTPPIGGGSLHDLAPETVIAEIKQLLPAEKTRV